MCIARFSGGASIFLSTLLLQSTFLCATLSLSLSLSIGFFFVKYLPTSVHLLMYLTRPVCLPFYLSVRQAFSLSICLSAYLLSIYPVISLHLNVLGHILACINMHISIYLTICIPIIPSISIILSTSTPTVSISACSCVSLTCIPIWLATCLCMSVSRYL